MRPVLSNAATARVAFAFEVVVAHVPDAQPALEDAGMALAVLRFELLRNGIGDAEALAELDVLPHRGEVCVTPRGAQSWRQLHQAQRDAPVVGYEHAVAVWAVPDPPAAVVALLPQEHVSHGES